MLTVFTEPLSWLRLGSVWLRIESAMPPLLWFYLYFYGSVEAGLRIATISVSVISNKELLFCLQTKKTEEEEKKTIPVNTSRGNTHTRTHTLKAPWTTINIEGSLLVFYIEISLEPEIDLKSTESRRAFRAADTRRGTKWNKVEGSCVFSCLRLWSTLKSCR